MEHDGTTVIGYCSNHNKNYCILCEHCNENNRKIDIELNDEQIKKYENDMNKNEEIIYEIDLLFNKCKKLFKKLEYNYLLFKENMNKKINFMNEIINFYKFKKFKCDINYQMKNNIEKNNFDLTETKLNISNNLNILIKEMNKFIILLKKNEITKEVNKFNDFKFENMKIFKILKNNQGFIYCIKILDDGRLAAADSKSNLIIYNKNTFYPDIIIENNLDYLFNFTQLKFNKIICAFKSEYTLKIIKIKNNNEYEDIQIIQNAHNNKITKILELKNENFVTFSYDFCFKIWKFNNKNNLYEKIKEFKVFHELSDGLEIEDNEILFAVNSSPQSILFYDLNNYQKIKTLKNLDLFISCLCRIIKLNDEQIAVAGNKKVYLIDINNYLILHEINSDNYNYCILKLSDNLFLIGDEKGNISQYKINNSKINKESLKKAHENEIFTMNILNDIIISGGYNSNEIKMWKK